VPFGLLAGSGYLFYTGEPEAGAALSGSAVAAFSINNKVSTFLLIFMINYFPKGGSRTVASFVTGMFGFTAIQALRRGFDE
jgi:hypothetical protein